MDPLWFRIGSKMEPEHNITKHNETEHNKTYTPGETKTVSPWAFFVWKKILFLIAYEKSSRRVSTKRAAAGFEDSRRHAAT